MTPPKRTPFLLCSAKVILQRMRMMASVEAQPQQPSSSLSSNLLKICVWTIIATVTIASVVAPKCIASIVRSTQKHTWSARWPFTVDVAPVLTKIDGGFEKNCRALWIIIKVSPIWTIIQWI